MKNIISCIIFLGFLGNLPAFSEDILTQYPLSQLEVEAIITGAPEQQAVLRGPNGEEIIARQGDTIGSEKGNIVDIGKAWVIVEERFKGENGEVIIVRQPLSVLGGIPEIRPIQ